MSYSNYELFSALIVFDRLVIRQCTALLVSISHIHQTSTKDSTVEKTTLALSLIIMLHQQM